MRLVHGPPTTLQQRTRIMEGNVWELLFQAVGLIGIGYIICIVVGIVFLIVMAIFSRKV